jgi:hypothetical protein
LDWVEWVKRAEVERVGVCVGSGSPGFLAALRMTARTDNGKNKCSSNGKNRQPQIPAG